MTRPKSILLAIPFLILFFIRAEEPNVYFGNLHSHTSYSDGSGIPADAYQTAKRNGLDFLAITEHNHLQAERGAKERRDGLLIAKNPELYEGPDADALIPTANRLTIDGRFVAIYGQEFSTISAGNHVNVFDVPKVISSENGNFAALVSWLDEHKDSSGKAAIIQFNHPNSTLRNHGVEYGADDFENKQIWIKKMGAVACLIEVLNGPGTKNVQGAMPEVFEGDYLHYLALGFHVTPAGNQDNHYLNHGLATDARTGVIASNLTKTGILSAIRERRTYATQDKNLRIVYSVVVDGQKHLLGSIIKAPGPSQKFHIELKLKDDDEPEASYQVLIYSGIIGEAKAKMIDKVLVDGDTDLLKIEDLTYEGGRQYFFLKIVQRDEDGNSDAAWTAPVWFETETAAEPQPQPDPIIFIASKMRAIYHSSPECRYAKQIAKENRVTGADAIKGREPCENCSPKN